MSVYARFVMLAFVGLPTGGVRIETATCKR